MDEKLENSSNENAVTEQNDRLSIHVKIAERDFPLNINREDEEIIRKAAKKINSVAMEYKKKYTGRDVQDALTMSALSFTVQLLRAEDNAVGKTIQNQLSDLNVELENYLQNHETK
jgi:cell division protein ZapA